MRLLLGSLMDQVAYTLARSFFFALPFVLAGLIHIVVIKRHLFPSLSRLPLDAGFATRGRRLFGKNKTVRGAVVTITGITIGVLLQSFFLRSYPGGASLSLVDFSNTSPLVWGLLLGSGCVIGELPNSFLKRQLDIPPGGRPSNPLLRTVTWIFDQIDSVIGVLLFASFKTSFPLLTIVLLLGVGLLIHPLGAIVMVRFRLKTRVA